MRPSILALVALLVLLGGFGPAAAGAVEGGVRPWPRADIPVWIHPEVRKTPRLQLLRRAMAEWNAATGVSFREVASPGPDVLHVYDRPRGARCDAKVGYLKALRRDGKTSSGGEMTLGACSYGSVLHELGHVLGLMHEHQRDDRAGFLDFKPIRSVLAACSTPAGCGEAALNVGAPRRTQLRTEYDPCSLMHYLADQSSKARQGRLPPSPGWSRWYLLTDRGEVNYRACRAALKPVPNCSYAKTGQKCQVTCQDANTAAVFNGLKPRQACWGRGAIRR